MLDLYISDLRGLIPPNLNLCCADVKEDAVILILTWSFYV